MNVDKINKEGEKKGGTGFSRSRVNHLINCTRKHPALFKIMLFFLDLSIRRPMIRFISQNYDGSLVGVEIGTYEGENAYNMLKHLSIKHLYCVDPYLQYDEYDDSFFEPSAIGENVVFAFETAQKHLSRFADKVTFIKEMSEGAVDKISMMVDFVYIDGNHSYSYVKQDIEQYFPKVKVGGVIGGHDIWINDVKRAVFEFAEKRELRVYVKHPDWWMIK